MQRFLTLTDVAETLNISGQAARALVRSGELQAIQVGGRGQWRIEVSWLEDYVERQKEVTRARVREWTEADAQARCCLLYTSPSPRDRTRSRMPSSA